MIDVGVGSGAVAVTLAVLLRRRGMADEVEITATDVAEDALQLAKENAVAHAVADRITFLTAGPAARVRTAALGRRRWRTCRTSAPTRSRTCREPRRSSRRCALDGGADGLQVIGRLLDQLPESLADDGVALLEIGGDQGEGMRALAAERLPGWSCEVEPDLGGLPRVAVLRRSAPRPPA